MTTPQQREPGPAEEPERPYPPGERADPPDDPPTGDDVPFRTPDPAELQGD